MGSAIKLGNDLGKSRATSSMTLSVLEAMSSNISFIESWLKPTSLAVAGSAPTDHSALILSSVTANDMASLRSFSCKPFY